MPKLPNEEFRALVDDLKDDEFKRQIYPEQEIQAINWTAYTAAQIKQVRRTLAFIRSAVAKCKIPSIHGRVGKPLTDPAVLTKAVLLAELLGTNERAAEGWTALLGHHIGIYAHLDDWVIGEAYARPEVASVLHQVFQQTITSNGELMGDGTGLERTRKQNYESTKRAGTYMTSIIDSREIVQIFDISGKQECQAMHELVKQVAGKSLRLDAGFNDRALVELIEQLCMTPYVYPKRINNLNGKESWKQMYLELLLDVYSWLKEYHQRSHCESFHSAFKRVYGIVTKVRYSARLAQITARVILHNFRRLEYFRLAGKD